MPALFLPDTEKTGGCPPSFLLHTVPFQAGTKWRSCVRYPGSCCGWQVGGSCRRVPARSNRMLHQWAVYPARIWEGTYAGMIWHVGAYRASASARSRCKVMVSYRPAPPVIRGLQTPGGAGINSMPLCADKVKSAPDTTPVTTHDKGIRTEYFFENQPHRRVHTI